MLDLIGQIKAFIKSGTIRIDNNVFTLHYRLTVIILVIFTLIISSRKYFGDPIDCTANTEPIKPIVDTFCWFNSYIIVRKDPNDPYNQDDPADVRHRYRTVINSAIKTYEELLSDPKSRHKPYFLHAYQWIEFILSVQAALFFIPRYFWRYIWEGGRVRALTENFQLVSVKQDDDKGKIIDIVKYIRRNKFEHFEYAWKYVVCEILNFTNALAQYLIVRRILGIDLENLIHDFFTSSSTINPESHLATVFPYVARCEVPTPGGGGHHYSTEFCVLPVNIFTTKMYIFLWFYFLGLTVLSGLSLVYRFAVIFSGKLRCFLLKRNVHNLPENCVRTLNKLGYGEWFLLYLVGKNMDPLSYKTLIAEYNDDLMTSRPSFSIIGSDKIYNADVAAMRSSLSKDSDR